MSIASKLLFLWIIDLLCVVYLLITAIIVSIERRPLTLFSHLLTTRQKWEGFERQRGRGDEPALTRFMEHEKKTHRGPCEVFSTVGVMFTSQN